MSGWTNDWWRLPLVGGGGGGGEEALLVLRLVSIVVEKRQDRNVAEKCLLAMHRPLEAIWAAIMMISSHLSERASKGCRGKEERGDGVDLLVAGLRFE